jgi:hypothetical protein
MYLTCKKALFLEQNGCLNNNSSLVSALVYLFPRYVREVSSYLTEKSWQILVVEGRCEYISHDTELVHKSVQSSVEAVLSWGVDSA